MLPIRLVPQVPAREVFVAMSPGPHLAAPLRHRSATTCSATASPTVTWEPLTSPATTSSRPSAASCGRLRDLGYEVDPVDAIKSIAVDVTMHEPARFVARQMTAAGRPAWLYRFGYVAESLRPKASGAEHSTELPFLFGTLDVRYGAARDAQRPRDGRYFHGLHRHVRQNRRSEP